MKQSYHSSKRTIPTSISIGPVIGGRLFHYDYIVWPIHPVKALVGVNVDVFVLHRNVRDRILVVVDGRLIRIYHESVE